MTKIKIAVKGNRAALVGRVELVAGTIGQPCVFYFDEEWKNLMKKVTYKVGPTLLGTYDIKSNEIVIPANVLTTAGLPLEIGITGYTANKTIITPTSWCLIGTIQPGTVICPPSSGTGNHVIYDGGVVVNQQEEEKHIIYDGGVID